jgi:hypothetical protein
VIQKWLSGTIRKRTLKKDRVFYHEMWGEVMILTCKKNFKIFFISLSLFISLGFFLNNIK